MKKLLYLLLFTPVIYLASCSKANVTPLSQSIEDVIVGQEWWDVINKNGFYLDTIGNAFDIEVCSQDVLVGDWIIDDDIIKIDIVDETGLHYIVPVIKILEYSDTTLKAEIIDPNNPNPVVPTYRNFTILFEDYIYGCMDSTAANYNSIALCTDTCIYDILGCMDSLAYNFNSNATIDNSSCCYVAGCTDSYALNYNPNACYNDGSCIGIVNGCTDINALNFNPNANLDDGSCCYVDGCTDQGAINYNYNACIDDGSCCFVAGCMDVNALNYDPAACYNDSSCDYNYSIGDFYNGGIVFWLDNSGEHGLVCDINEVQGGTDAFYNHWGCYGQNLVGADGIVVGTGNQNTLDILSSCSSGHTFADYCATLNSQGYSDWFLPSKGELEEINQHFSIISQVSILNGGFGLQEGTYTYYVSSTDGSAQNYWSVHLNSGGGSSSVLHNKPGGGKLRAVREF